MVPNGDLAERFQPIRLNAAGPFIEKLLREPSVLLKLHVLSELVCMIILGKFAVT